jgi:hypothetical protein
MGACFPAGDISASVRAGGRITLRRIALVSSIVTFSSLVAMRHGHIAGGPPDCGMPPHDMTAPDGHDPTRFGLVVGRPEPGMFRLRPPVGTGSRKRAQRTDLVKACRIGGRDVLSNRPGGSSSGWT